MAGIYINQFLPYADVQCLGRLMEGRIKGFVKDEDVLEVTVRIKSGGATDDFLDAVIAFINGDKGVSNGDG